MRSFCPMAHVRIADLIVDQMKIKLDVLFLNVVHLRFLGITNATYVELDMDINKEMVKAVQHVSDVK